MTLRDRMHQRGDLLLRLLGASCRHRDSQSGKSADLDDGSEALSSRNQHAIHEMGTRPDICMEGNREEVGELERPEAGLETGSAFQDVGAAVVRNGT